LAWAVDPLAFSVCFPPQLTLATEDPVVALPPVALLSLPQPDNTIALAATMLNAPPVRFNFNLLPQM